jgi:hypothetical protein
MSLRASANNRSSSSNDGCRATDATPLKRRTFEYFRSAAERAEILRADGKPVPAGLRMATVAAHLGLAQRGGARAAGPGRPGRCGAKMPAASGIAAPAVAASAARPDQSTARRRVVDRLSDQPSERDRLAIV